MAITYIDYPLKADQYVREETAKTHIVWHGTMGRTKYTPHKGKPGKATTSIDGWNTDGWNSVGATYLIDRNGDTYRCFDEKYWIHHLGLKNTNGKYDRNSIGIELANELCLIKDAGKFYAFGNISIDNEYVGPTFSRNWRNFDHWAALDVEQVDRAIELTLELCARHDIEPSFYKPSTKRDYPACFEKATITCHSNCRQDKTDLLLEDWVWDKIANAGIAIVEN